MPANILALLPGWAFAFALVLARGGAAIMVLPGFADAEVPARLRIGFALAVTLLLLPGLLPLMPPQPETIPALLGMVAAELFTGATLGWLARLVVLALPVGGQFLASMTGLANILQPDAAMGAETTAIARMLTLLAPVLLLASGLYAWPLLALGNSYQVVAPGALLPAADSARAILAAVAAMFALAVRLAGPFLLAGIIWQFALGLLARLVPRLQVYFLAMPGQILASLVLLGVLLPVILRQWLLATTQGFALLPGLR